MVDFFYGLPIWVATILVLGAALAVGLGSSFGLRYVFHRQSTTEDTQTALSLMQVVAAYIGILIAFAGVQVWQDFSDAQNAVHREAASASQLYRDLATYGPETLAARQQLRLYIDTVVSDEWPLLSHGKSSERTDISLFKLFHAVGQLNPADSRQTTIYAGIFGNLNELVGFRRDRLIHSESGMPIILWIVALFGSVLIVSYTATFRYNRTNVIMISGISLALGLVFLFILVVDRPFMGSFSVSSSELSGLTAKFDMIDRLSGTGAAEPAPATAKP